MNRNIIYTIVALATITSCSKQERPVPPTDSGVSINLRVQEREGEEWYGQTINVYMLEKDTVNNRVKIAKDGNGTTIYSNAKMNAPKSGNTGEATPVGGRKSYPTFGNFDFWAFSINEAEIGAVSVGGYKISVPFTMNGRHDILVGKADATTDTIGSSFNSNVKKAKNDFAKHVYSAYAARYGVQPSIKFQHLLSKLMFSITADKESLCDDSTGVYVDSIKVSSKYKGTMYAAFTKPAQMEEGISQISWRSVSTYFYVKNDKGEPISNIHPQFNTELPIGEPLYTGAGTSTHTIRVLLRSKTSKGKTTTKWVTNQVFLENGEKMKPGQTYKVSITINSATTINVQTTPVE